MKIGLITFHFAYNYGAVLQAWAMQTYLESFGHEVQIIDYRPLYHTERYGVTRSLSVTARNLYRMYPKQIIRIARGIIGTLIENILLYSTRKKKRDIFEGFINENLKITQQCHSMKDIENIADYFEILIAGSDQIWNTNLTNQTFDDAYFLQFGNPACKRIVYAASIGETLPVVCVEHIKRLKYRLNAISCREVKDSISLQKYGLQDMIFCVPDPTILLNSTLYYRLGIHKDKNFGYVLLYILTPNSLLEQEAEQIAKRGKPVISISPIKINAKGVKINYPISPISFLSMISNADLILTNSFHGTSFSIIFKKKFIVGVHGKRNERLENLLSIVGLKERLVSTVKELEAINHKPINYKAVTESLNKYRLNGKSFIENMITI